MNTVFKQHLIDPEICIRCGTCEEMCPRGAVSHNDDNYVVDASICDHSMDCISPCPTGAIDNWRVVIAAYSVEEQLEWMELPDQTELTEGSGGGGDVVEALDDEISALLDEAHKGMGGRMYPPPSASKPSVNLYSRAKPARAVVQGNFRLTGADADADVRHIILDLGETSFPVLEGQCLGVLPPGTDENGKPHGQRLYTISSPRDGERPNHNNLSLTVKREEKGICSNYLCDLKKGDVVELTGPFGATFLMPDDTSTDLVMICTGTGSAPMRAMTEHRRRANPNGPGHLYLYFGARRPEELPYFGPLKKVPESLLTQYLVFSRQPDLPKEYVQDRMRANRDELADLLRKDTTYFYVCGLKAMESGVEEALADVCRHAGMDWREVRDRLRETGRYHVETY